MGRFRCNPRCGMSRRSGDNQWLQTRMPRLIDCTSSTQSSEIWSRQERCFAKPRVGVPWNRTSYPYLGNRTTNVRPSDYRRPVRAWSSFRTLPSTRAGGRSWSVSRTRWRLRSALRLSQQSTRRMSPSAATTSPYSAIYSGNPSSGTTITVLVRRLCWRHGRRHVCRTSIPKQTPPLSRSHNSFPRSSRRSWLCFQRSAPPSQQYSPIHSRRSPLSSHRHYPRFNHLFPNA